MTTVLESTKRIARFEVIRALGRGGQGAVWLAHDPDLRRDVAIKTLTMDGSHASVQALLDEAVIVSRLAHPNIVTLYGAGQEDGNPYLVFEYVGGHTLAMVIRDGGRLMPTRAVEIAIQMLRALHSAHLKDVVHRDVKPANVMITDDGVARVMDFSIAALMSDELPGEKGFHGTPAYMAPEYVADRSFGPRSDVFSVGMVLYEMLTGQPAVAGDNVLEVMHRLANLPFKVPSALVPELDEQLDAIVMRALIKLPGERYQSAEQMAESLAVWLAPAVTPPGEAVGTNGTLDFVLRRIRHKGDFPSLANTIGAINRAADSDSEDVASLSGSILKDFALTNKLLRLVNTARYGQFGGSISTVSRAIVVLGYETIRTIAVTLMLFEHLQNKSQAIDLKDEVLASYFGGVLARELVAKAGIRDAEEAFICAMFHNLGRLLVAFYLYEEHREIQTLVGRGTDYDKAAVQVLGVSCLDLGAAIARSWNFPDKIVRSMCAADEAQARKSANDGDRLQMLSQLTSNVCDLIRDVPADRRRARLKALATRYGTSLGFTAPQLEAAVRSAVEEVAHNAPGLDLVVGTSSFMREAMRTCNPDAIDPSGADEPASSALANTVLKAPTDAATQPAQRHLLLAVGIQDISQSLVGDYQLNDILRVILETMYLGMGFTRVLLCIHHPATQSLKSRFGFGPDTDRIIRDGFAIPLAEARDVFNVAISRGADIHVEDVNAPSIRTHVPAWYRERITAQSLALFPVMVNGKPFGLFYGDCDQAHGLNFGADTLAQLKTLRNQAVLAIKASRR